MVNNPILYAAIMIFWLVALTGFLIMSSVYRIVNIMSLVVPATACLLILCSLGAIIIAQWTQWSPGCKIWNHSTSVHNWRYWQQNIWNKWLYSSTAEVSGFLVCQLLVTYFGFCRIHFNRSVGSVKFRLQNMKSQYQCAHWKVLTAACLELEATVLACWRIRIF